MGHSKVPQRWCDGEVGCFPLTLGVRCYKVSNPYPTHRGPLYRGGMHQSINVISIQREIPMSESPNHLSPTPPELSSIRLNYPVVFYR